MFMKGKPVELMVHITPQIHREYIKATKNGVKILYIRVQNALYKMLKSALLFNSKLWNDLENQGFQMTHV